MNLMQLDTPIIEDLGVPYTLVATWAGLVDAGLRAQVDIYEDSMFAYPDQVTLGSAHSRALYVKGALAKVPALDQQILETRLVQLLPKVEAALKVQMAAPPAPTGQRVGREIVKPGPTTLFTCSRAICPR